LFQPLPKDDVLPTPLLGDDDALARLGQQLFFDPRLSAAGDRSCASCHSPAFGGAAPPAIWATVDPTPTPAPKGKNVKDLPPPAPPLNVPSVWNASVHTRLFWDGHALDLEQLTREHLLADAGMENRDAATVERVLRSIPGYAPLFAAAFPADSAPKGAVVVTFDRAVAALVAHMQKLLTPTRFDAWLAGDEDALSLDERRGFLAFVHAGCAMCHRGQGVGGSDVQPFGLLETVEGVDPNRPWKVPGLRNLSATAPFFHDGSVATLDEAIRVMAWHQLGRHLDEQERALIADFLRTLDGSPAPSRLVPPVLPDSGPQTPKPKAPPDAPSGPLGAPSLPLP
jgi:cytochrome c peroxidase